MFFSDDHIPDMEKIDRIYKMLRAQRRARIFWLLIKLSILGAIVYGFYYLGLPENTAKKEELSKTVQTKMIEFIAPMVGSMVQDLTQSMQIPGQVPVSSTTTSNRNKNTKTNWTLPANITPEMIKAVQDAMQKK